MPSTGIDEKKIQDRVLVVDDDKISRQKIALAVKALGYGVVSTSNGYDALTLLEQEAFDLVLLDIVMPDLDGFQVLKTMKANDKLHEIPVIVISGLDSEMGSVVQAIELGAEDFLPKSFERVLLRARVNTCIEKKKRRDQEIAYIRDVDRLTQAATILEAGNFNPELVGLERISSRPDALGNLARVFTDMAQQIYARERKLQQQVRTLKGVVLLLVVGVILGLTVPLSRIASGIDSHPIGLTIWVNAIGFVICFSIDIFRWKFLKIDKKAIKILLVWGILTAVAEVFLFLVAQQMQASIISIILVTEGFIVFAIESALRIEQPSPKRLIGLAVGFGGVILIIVSAETQLGISGWGWFLVALIVPACYALEDIVIAAKIPSEWNVVSAIGCVSLTVTIILLPVAFLFDDFIVLDYRLGTLEWVVTGLAIVGIIGTVLLIRLIQTTGAVFGSQVGYVLTFSGIAWSMLILNESLPLIAWVALSVMVVGLLLVEPKEEAEERPNLAS